MEAFPGTDDTPMTDTITLRPAQRGDIPLILSLIAELAEYERLAHEAVASEEDLFKALFGPRPAAEVVIAELEGRPVGFALFFISFSTFLGRPGLYLEDLYVRPDVRGRGVGKRLMVHLAGLCVERGYGRFEWSVLDWNAPSIAFYRSLGAVPMEEWTVQRVHGPALQALAGRCAVPAA